jgi:hypothetical protein
MRPGREKEARDKVFICECLTAASTRALGQMARQRLLQGTRPWPMEHKPGMCGGGTLSHWRKGKTVGLWRRINDAGVLEDE